MLKELSGAIAGGIIVLLAAFFSRGILVEKWAVSRKRLLLIYAKRIKRAQQEFRYYNLHWSSEKTAE